MAYGIGRKIAHWRQSRSAPPQPLYAEAAAMRPWAEALGRASARIQVLPRDELGEDFALVMSYAYGRAAEIVAQELGRAYSDSV